MKWSRDQITSEVLHELLSYSPETGELRWKPRPAKYFSGGTRPIAGRVQRWNSAFAGKVALTSLDTGGYPSGAVLEYHVAAHRVIWAMCHGSWSTGDIDHINGIKTDNRLTNLRAVSHEENLHNQPRRATNTSGVTGVYFRPRTRSPWRAAICVDSKLKWLGSFATFEEAVTARKAAEQQFGYHPNHDREVCASAV